MNQKAVRIVALVLAIIMAGGVLIVAFSNIAGAFDANEPAAMAAGIAPHLIPTAAQGDANSVVSPQTGTDGIPKAPVIIGVVAVLLIVACVVVPKISKKK